MSDVFEPRTDTGRELFVCQDSGFSHIFKPIVCTTEEILGNINVVMSVQGI